MDKRSWPWRKKPSEKQTSEKTASTVLDASAAAAVDANATQADQAKQDTKKPKYVQISMELYAHLTGLEDQMKSYDEQVKTLEDEVADLHGKLTDAHSEITNKENLVKQHTKVAEEAVSGWEKAEAEAAALKSHLESVTLLKLTAEDRASHLDGALKECMRQMRNLKEEHDQKLHEVILNKTKQFDKMKLELEMKISNLDQELLISAAENAALSRSLQERSSMLVKLGEEKSQAEGEIQLLKTKIESCEKEVSSHKYELHIARKEVEIRNEEKNMSVRSAEVANKQHLEGVKKIAKLEAECQRLRGLVRKRLPGPAALAQMKLEVENLGQDYRESRIRRSPVRPPSSHLSQLSEFSLDSTQKCLKGNELLTERLLAMDEEMKMLKEALARRNSELQASRSLFAQTAIKLQNFEAQLHAGGEHRNSLKSNVLIPFDQNVTNPSSFATFSEDGNDDSVSCAGSCATVVTSEVSYSRKEKDADGEQKSGNANHLDLMDDFLEMEKLAYQSNGTVQNPNISGNIGETRSEVKKSQTSFACTTKTGPISEGDHSSDSQLSSIMDATFANPELLADPIIFVKLDSKISTILQLISSESDVEKVTEEIRQAMLDVQGSLRYLSEKSVETGRSVPVNDIHSLCEDSEKVGTAGISDDGNTCTEISETNNQELEIAISRIFDFLMILGKEAEVILMPPDGAVMSKMLHTFSAKYNKTFRNGMNLTDYVTDISNVLGKASELRFNILGFKSSEVENGSSDCIDKIALSENKDVNLSGDRYPIGCAHFSDSASDPDVPQDGNLVPISESTTSSWKCSLEEFEQLKSDKENLALDLTRCSEDFEMSKSQLLETEQLLTEVKSQLISSQKANSLAETQLKCMAESYNSLEARAEELQSKLNLLQRKVERLNNELQEERKGHQDALTRCKDLQEQLLRIDCCQAADNNDKISQEMELAAAAEKLAECQETIFLLGKQLNAMRPQIEFSSPPNNGSIPKCEYPIDENPTIRGVNLDSPETDNATGSELWRAGFESSEMLSSPKQLSPSDFDMNNIMKSPVSRHSKHRATDSGSSSSASSTPTPERQIRGFSRFFSSKGKTGQ